MAEKDGVRQATKAFLVAVAVIAVADVAARRFLDVEPRTEVTLAMLDLGAAAFFAFALYRMAHRQAEANEALARLERAREERAEAVFELRRGSGEFRPPEELRAAGAEVGVVFEVLNRGRHDSAVDRAFFEVEAPDGSWERVEATGLRRTSAGAADDLMVRSGERVGFHARVRLGASFPAPGGTVRLVVEPVLGREGRMELRT